MEFKLDLPESCPPLEATSCEINPVYRLVKNETLVEEDMLSHIELSKPFPPAMLCAAHAISFNRSKEGCAKLRKKILKFRNRKIKEFKILESYGVNDSYLNVEHINLWVYKGIELYKEMEGGNKDDEL